MNVRLNHVYQSTSYTVCGSAGVRGTMVTTHQLLRGAAEHILRFSCAQRWLLQPKLRCASPEAAVGFLLSERRGRATKVSHKKNQGRGTVLARGDTGYWHTAGTATRA